MKLNELTLAQATGGIRTKQFSVTELASAYLERVAAEEKNIHAYLEVFDNVLATAGERDTQLAHYSEAEIQRLPPLFGIPLAVKDNILVEGKRCSAGSKMLAHYVAPYDATVIKKLKNQGAIFLGKTNLDEFAMGSSTENSSFGPTKNPRDPERVPGGSSGGSAAAVAAHLSAGALGSDTGGSIRQPASFCGVVGFKPTYGAVSRHGLIAMGSSLDQIGPLAKTVEDAKILFSAITGQDIFDSTTFDDARERSPTKELKELTAGIPKEYFDSGLDPEVREVVTAAIKKIENAGAAIQEVTLPHVPYALPTYYIVVPSEVSANLARYDGIRYGSQSMYHEAQGMNLYDTYAETRAGGFGPEVKRRIILGTYALSHGYYDAYYLKAQKVRHLLQKDFTRAFEKVDFLIGPTTPTPAFRFGEAGDDPLKMYLADIYTVAINLAGIPAISIPAGYVRRDARDLPVGIQLIGAWGEDEKLLSLAGEVEKLG